MLSPGHSRALAICSTAVSALLLSGCGSQYTPPQEIAEAAKQLPEEIDYNWDVRPILSQNCFNCHGNSTQEGGLRLDSAEHAFADLPESPGKRAIAPGKPEASELIRRITSTDIDERMPPKQAHKVLSPAEIATLVKWVEDGAEYKEHWAYIPPNLDKPDKTQFEERVVNPIDRYIFAKLEE